MANIDPNKYIQNKKIQPESKWSVFLAIIRMSVMIVGIVGISMELFREDGWLKILLGKIFQTNTSLLSIPVIILVSWLINRWMSTPNKSEISKNGDIPMYLMMGIGVYYLYKLIFTGNF